MKPASSAARIETEHLVLGVFREDKALANQFLASEAIRHSIPQRGTTGLKVATSVDLPLSHESKRALVYAAEESERMNHKHIGTVHLLLGLLREENSFGAQLLREQGLTLDLVREEAKQSEPLLAQGQSISIAGFDQWLAEREAPGGIWIVKRIHVANRTIFAIYATDPPLENEKGEDLAPVQKLAQIQERIDFIIKGMESAIANHEFEKARLYADEERKERENLRLLREQFNLEETLPPVPLLCIEIIRDDRFSGVQKRCDDYIAKGVAQVWLLHPGLKRAYTVTNTDGLREFKGEILQIANPPLEMDLSKIFD